MGEKILKLRIKPKVRFGLTTFGLQNHCSPTELFGHLACAAGLEPATLEVETQCSNPTELSTKGYLRFELRNVRLKAVCSPTERITQTPNFRLELKSFILTE